MLYKRPTPLALGRPRSTAISLATPRGCRELLYHSSNSDTQVALQLTFTLSAVKKCLAICAVQN